MEIFGWMMVYTVFALVYTTWDILAALVKLLMRAKNL